MAPQQFARLLASEIDGRAQNTRFRQTQFHALQKVLLADIEAIRTALAADSGNSAEEITAEICLTFNEIKTHYESLSLEDDLEREYRIANGKDNEDAARGTGIVYVIPTSHTMFFSAISAVVGGIVAGNCVVLELPKNTMALPPLLSRLLTQALDADTFAIAEMKPDSSFLEKVVVVAQTNVGTASYPQALTSPVTARTVAVVDRTADLSTAAQSLVAARFAFGGRSTYAPDIVLVHEFALKGLVEALILHSSKYLSGPEGEEREKAVAVSNNPRRTAAGQSVLDAANKDPSARILVSGSQWGVVEVHDRASVLLKRKIGERVLILHPVTSLDDAIEVCADFGTLAATYAFAAPPSAKYLTQFIDAHVSYINQIPFEMLIGPALPIFPTIPSNINTVHPRSTRYTQSTFQVPRPQFISESPSGILVRKILSVKSNSKETLDIWNTLAKPLPPTKQKNGPRIGFFEQGIITGGVITLTSLIGAVATVGYYAVVLLRRV
ncbi:Aldehyde/histidinol dehydrogenase [Aspergillus venezuelensis]